MHSLRLVLGCKPLLETDLAALPALRGLCQALHIRAHWDDQEQTFYVGSPVKGRKVAVVAAPGEIPWQEALAVRIATALQAHLCAAGAQAALEAMRATPTAPAAHCDLALHIAVRTQPQGTVTASYNWLHWAQARKLAAALAEDVARAAGVLNLGARLSLTERRQAGTPQIEVVVGLPPAIHSPDMLAPGLHDAVAGGLFEALARIWADPVLERLQQRPPEPSAAPEPALVAVAAELEPGAEPLAALLAVPAHPRPQPQPEPAATQAPDPVPPSPAPLTPRKPGYDPRRAPGNSAVHVFRVVQPHHSTVIRLP